MSEPTVPIGLRLGAPVRSITGQRLSVALLCVTGFMMDPRHPSRHWRGRSLSFGWCGSSLVTAFVFFFNSPHLLGFVGNQFARWQLHPLGRNCSSGMARAIDVWRSTSCSRGRRPSSRSATTPCRWTYFCPSWRSCSSGVTGFGSTPR